MGELVGVHGNGKGFPKDPGGQVPQRKEQRRESARVRQEWSDQLSLHEKLRRAKSSPHNRSKEVAKFSRRIERIERDRAELSKKVDEEKKAA